MLDQEIKEEVKSQCLETRHSLPQPYPREQLSHIPTEHNTERSRLFLKVLPICLGAVSKKQIFKIFNCSFC